MMQSWKFSMIFHHLFLSTNYSSEGSNFLGQNPTNHKYDFNLCFKAGWIFLSSNKLYLYTISMFLSLNE